MKKIYLSILLAPLCLTSCSLKGPHHDISDYMSNLTYHDNFCVMTLADIHLSCYNSLTVDLNYLDFLVENCKIECNGKIDLIIFLGDIFTFGTKQIINDVYEHIDSWRVPWTFVFGNHDEQIFAHYEYAVEEAASGRYPHCVFKYFNDDIHGLTNSIINLRDENYEIAYQIYCVDSNTYSYAHGPEYDYVHTDQINWYKEGIEYANKDLIPGQNRVKSSIFQHIAIPEFKDALELYRQNPLIGTGVANEGISSPNYNSGFFDTILDEKSSEAMIVGHDHTNNFDINYKDVHFIYAAKSSKNIYYDPNLMGYRLFTLNKNEKIKSSLHYFSYEGEPRG